MLLGCLKTLQRPYQILDWYWALAFLWQNNNIAKCADGRVGKPHSKGSKFLVSKCLYCFSPDWLEKPPHSSHFPKCYSKRHQKPFVRQMSCRSWEKVAVKALTIYKSHNFARKPLATWYISNKCLKFLFVGILTAYVFPPFQFFFPVEKVTQSKKQSQSQHLVNLFSLSQHIVAFASRKWEKKKGCKMRYRIFPSYFRLWGSQCLCSFFKTHLREGCKRAQSFCPQLLYVFVHVFCVWTICGLSNNIYIVWYFRLFKR